jgi:chromosome segregation ATPase
MYRDLSAQLAAKDEELAEANQELSRLRDELEQVRGELAEATHGMGNRDAVLKNALSQNADLTKPLKELQAKLQEGELQRAALRREVKEARAEGLLTGLASLLDSWRK